jgi:low temperature requirement protein LtrA
VFRTGDRHDVFASGEQPSESELGGRDLELLGERVDSGEHREVTLEVPCIHVPLLLALTAVGAGAQLLIEPTGSHANVAGAWAFDGGASLYLLCLTINQRLTQTGLRQHIPLARAACAALLLATASLTPAGSALAAAALTASGLLLLVLFEVRTNLQSM